MRGSLILFDNAMVLSPTGGDMEFNTVSYDLFRTLQDALLTPWDPATVFLKIWICSLK